MEAVRTIPMRTPTICPGLHSAPFQKARAEASNPCTLPSMLPSPGDVRGMRQRDEPPRIATCIAVFTAIALASVLQFYGQESTSPQASSAKDIISMLRSEQFGSAHEAAQRLINQHPHDCELLSLDGLAFNGMKQIGAASRTFHQALQYCPNDLLALEGAAQASYALKDPDAAVLLKRILLLRPDDVTSHAMLASIYRANRECATAIPHFKASQSLFASSPKLQEGYAFCLMSTGDAKGAVENYRAVLDAHPDRNIRYNYALVLWKLQDPAAAWQVIQPLLATDASQELLGLGAEVAEASGHTPEAVQLLRKAILANPKNQENYLRFAQLSFTHNSFQVGIDMLNAGLAQLPEASRLYLERGVLEVQLSLFDSAISDFQKAHQLDPQLSLAIDAMGILQSQQHNADAALQSLRHEAEQHPQDSLLQYLYAEALSQASSEPDALQKAIAAAEESVKIEPGYQPAHDLLAVLYLRADKPDRAAAEAKAAQAIDPNDETAVYQELVARRRLGQTTEVAQLVKRLAEVRKKNAEQQQKSQGYVLKDEPADP